MGAEPRFKSRCPFRDNRNLSRPVSVGSITRMRTLADSRIAAARFSRLALFLFVLLIGGTATAASWSGIEPFRSKRADVEHVLGPPEQDDMAVSNSLRFKVAGGTVVVSFVDARFATAKKLSSSKIGTVQQIMLIHNGGSDTPESLNLVGNKAFERQDSNGNSVFRNLRDGIAYTFIGGTLRTTYFFAAGRSGIRTITGEFHH